MVKWVDREGLMNLFEFDSYVKDLVEKNINKIPIVTPPSDYRYNDTVGVTIDYDSLNIEVDCKGLDFSGDPSCINWNAKGKTTLKNYSKDKTTTKEDVANANLGLANIELPTLSITQEDISLIAFYIASRSNLERSFAKDLERLAYIMPMESQTLYVKKELDGSVHMRYNPQFIGNGILRDYINHFSGLPEYKNYKGAKTTLAFVIGHELLHYRYNHFDPKISTALKLLHYGPKLMKVDSDTNKCYG